MHAPKSHSVNHSDDLRIYHPEENFYYYEEFTHEKNRFDYRYDDGIFSQLRR